MGTGSFGGGGSGGSGYGSDGGIGIYSFEKGKFVSKIAKSDTVKEELQKKLRKFPKDYVKSRFGSRLVQSSYEEIFKLSRYVYEEDPCKALASEYRIDEGEGFFIRWVEKIMDNYQQHEPNTNIRDLVRICLEDFLVNALGDDIDFYLRGTCTQVLAKLNQAVFKSTSGYFLGYMIRRILEREYEQQQPSVQIQIQKQSQILADKIIRSFEQQFLTERQVTHRDFFRIIQKNIDWFVEELRK